MIQFNIVSRKKATYHKTKNSNLSTTIVLVLIGSIFVIAIISGIIKQIRLYRMRKMAERSRHAQGSITGPNILNKALPTTPEPTYDRNQKRRIRQWNEADFGTVEVGK
jgi:predicted permease